MDLGTLKELGIEEFSVQLAVLEAWREQEKTLSDSASEWRNRYQDSKIEALYLQHGGIDGELSYVLPQLKNRFGLTDDGELIALDDKGNKLLGGGAKDVIDELKQVRGFAAHFGTGQTRELQSQDAFSQGGPNSDLNAWERVSLRRATA